MVFRLAAGAVAEVVVPLGLAKVGFLSGCTGLYCTATHAKDLGEKDSAFESVSFVMYKSINKATVNLIFCQYSKPRWHLLRAASTSSAGTSPFAARNRTRPFA
jgi:hypothetical protein